MLGGASPRERWHDGRAMQPKCLAHLLPVPLAALCLFAARPARAGTLLTQSDVVLALNATTDGTSYAALDATSLAGFFGVHRCLCPDTLAVQLQLTSSGQTNLGNSTIGVTFLLGANCAAAPTSCLTLGSASFSSAQSAPSPTFSSNLVYQSAAGTTQVSCTALSAGSTSVWAILTQDGQPLGFAPSLDLPVVTTVVGPPTKVAAQPGNQGMLVTWSAPSTTSQVAGYQVLCLPSPTTAQTPGYESCGLAAGTATTLSPGDTSEVCSAVLPASATSVRLSGLSNGTSYTVGVIAIDPSGGVSALSSVATATPQPTDGFWQKYKQDGGAASGCSIGPGPRHAGWPVLVLLAVLLVWLGRRRARRSALLAGCLMMGWAATASAQGDLRKESDDWAVAQSSPSRAFMPPDWALELGLSWYRPAIDDELSNGYRPFADTFSGSRRPLWEAEVVRYLGHGVGTWGIGLRSGYYRVTAAAFLADGTRGGDETALRLIPFSPSFVYRANGLPGLRRVPLTPYAKLGLDATYWTVTTTASASQSGVSLGWHAAAGVLMGFDWLDARAANPQGIADPCALFFEWDYAAVNGLGITHSLHVGDDIWFAGIMFDL